MSGNGLKTKKIEIPAVITVRDLAHEMDASPIEVIKSLMAIGVMANINQQIDYDTAAVVAAEMGYEAALESQAEASEEDQGETPLWRRIIASVIMIRTQISLTKPEDEAAKREAARLGISLAELLRRSLRTMIPADDSKPWMRYAGMVESGDAQSTRHVDDVVYGQKA